MKLTEAKLKELIEEALSESRKGSQHQNIKMPWNDHIVPVLKHAFEEILKVEVDHRKGLNSKLVLKASPPGVKNFDVEVVWHRYLFGIQIQYQGGGSRIYLRMKDFQTMDDYTEAVFEAAENLVKRWR